MSAAFALVTAALVAVAVLAAREKARQRDREVLTMRGSDVPPPRPTPLSQGIVDLVAVAGGIYLSLVMVASFVGFSIPGKVEFLGGNIDPVAALSVFLALIEPFVSRLFEKPAQ